MADIKGARDLCAGGRTRKFAVLAEFAWPDKAFDRCRSLSFPWILSVVFSHRQAQIPEIAWPLLIMSEAVEHEQNGSKLVEDVGGFGHISGRNCCVNHPLHLEKKWGRSSGLDMLIDNIE